MFGFRQSYGGLTYTWPCECARIDRLRLALQQCPVFRGTEWMTHAKLNGCEVLNRLVLQFVFAMCLVDFNGTARIRASASFWVLQSSQNELQTKAASFPFFLPTSSTHFPRRIDISPAHSIQKSMKHSEKSHISIITFHVHRCTLSDTH